MEGRSLNVGGKISKIIYYKILIELFLTSLTPCSLLRPLHTYMCIVVYVTMCSCYQCVHVIMVKTGVLDNLDYILTPKRKYLYIELGN